MESAIPYWKKSSYSGGNGNCVEVAFDGNEVSVRDSKDAAGDMLTVDSTQWTEFMYRLKE